MEKLNSLYEKGLYITMVLSCAMLLFMTIMISLDVGLRNAGLQGLPWVMEVSEYILFLSTFLAAPWVFRLGAHVRVDLIVRNLPHRALMPVQIFADLVGLSICLFLLYFGTRTVFEALSLNSRIFKQLVIPEWWLLIFIPITGFLITVEFMFRLYNLTQGELADRVREEPSEGGS